MVTIDNFYQLNIFSSPKIVTLISEKLNYGLANDLIRGYIKNLDFPIDFEQKSGNEWTPILNPYSVSFLIVSKEFVDSLVYHQIKGWKSFDIEIFDLNGSKNSTYYGLSIIGRVGPIDYSKSKIVERKRVENGPVVRFYKEMHIGLDQWDQSDIFLVEDTLQIIISEKMKLVIEEFSPSNVKMINLKDYEISEISVPREKRIL